MANAGCINAYDCNGCLIQTLQNLDSACIGVGVQYTAPNPLDDKRLDYIKYTDKCGCVQCLSAENEILIYATNGVIKNLTLTNDDVNEAIKIKWNDIFGSNRAKTVVRYKTGSYPVSITDGTLAVEETTKNQYSSTPFSMSATDGVTYYFTAFAIAQDDTMIDVQTNSIEASFGRKPTQNTIARYKLESDLIDYSGNNHNGTWNGSGSFTTVGGKLSANFNTNNYIDTGIITGSGPITIACIFYHNTTSGNYQTVIGSPLSRNGASNPHIGMCFQNSIFYRRAGRFYESESSMPALSSFERHFGAIRIDSNGNVKLNIDDNQKTGTTSSFTINANILIGAGAGNRFNGNVKQVAIWNESITDEELTKFKTKALS